LFVEHFIGEATGAFEGIEFSPNIALARMLYSPFGPIFARFIAWGALNRIEIGTNPDSTGWGQSVEVGLAPQMRGEADISSLLVVQ
jgi:hypothetical protein